MAAAVITWDDVVTIAPELATAPEPRQTEILAIVGNQVPVLQWGTAQRWGQIYLAAHLGTLSRRRGEGPTTQKHAGQLSEAYASMLQFGALGMTSYGMEYARQVRLLTSVAFGMVS